MVDGLTMNPRDVNRFSAIRYAAQEYSGYQLSTFDHQLPYAAVGTSSGAASGIISGREC
jgi:hypothetical protein